MKKDSKAGYLFLYTVVFLTVSFAVFFSFLQYRKSFVATVDGQSQYILYLRYTGQYLRNVLTGFVHGNFHPASYDFSIGIGDDIGAIVRFHPLDLLSVFIPAKFTEQLYAVILLLRFYLAGLAFSYYAFSAYTFAGREGLHEKSASSLNVLTGSLVYVFCGYMLIRVTNHPTYAAPFVVLPLLFLGMEKVISHRGNLLFPLAVLLGFWSNYYFMYICSIAILVYALLRYPEAVKEGRFSRFFGYAGKLIGLYLVGLLMSMATLLPALLRYRESYRTSQTSAMQNLLIYEDKRRYAAWFLNLISPYQSSGNGVDLNFAVIVLPALAVLFTSAYRKYRTLRYSLLLELLALLVPFFGYVFAAMNNENNRWMFLIAFSLGMACVRTIDAFADPGGKELRNVLLVSFLFLAAAACERILIGGNRYNEAGAAQLLGFLLILLLIRRRKLSTGKVRIAMLVLTAFSCGLNGYLTFSPRGGYLIKSYQDMGNTTQCYDRLDRGIAAEIDDPSFYRVDAGYVWHGLENSAEHFGYNSIGMYNSILNTRLIRTLLEENNAGLDAITQVHDLDGRPVSENLAHVKYFMAGEDNRRKVPYGYSETPVLSGDGIEVYENENLLSAGFTSDRFITWEDYDKLTDIEKDLVRLDAVVLPKEGGPSEEELKAEGLTEVKKPSAAISSVPAEFPADGTEGKEKNISCRFQAKGGTYTFLRLKGLHGAADYENMKVLSDGIKTHVVLRSEKNVHTIGRTDYLFNLGYNAQDADRKVTVRFGKKAVHRLDSAEIISVSMDGYEEKIAGLNEESLDHEEIRNGLLAGTIKVSGTKLAVFTVALKDGWDLTVDGKNADIIPLDGMYAGTLLTEGEHEIRLSYHTPGGMTGILCTLAGIILFLLLCVSEKRTAVKRRL